jgi:hypothetical protein
LMAAEVPLGAVAAFLMNTHIATAMRFGGEVLFSGALRNTGTIVKSVRAKRVDFRASTEGC